MFELIINNERITKGDVKDLLTQPCVYPIEGMEIYELSQMGLSKTYVLQNLNLFLYTVDGHTNVLDDDEIVFYDFNFFNLLIWGIRYKKMKFSLYKQGQLLLERDTIDDI